MATRWQHTGEREPVVTKMCSVRFGSVDPESLHSHCMNIHMPFNIYVYGSERIFYGLRTGEEALNFYAQHIRARLHLCGRHL
jgi:hypothetical protein